MKTLTKRMIAVPLAAAVLCAAVHGQNAPLESAGANFVPPLIRDMAASIWDVQQRMWLGPQTEPVSLPPAVARRRLVADAFLEEVMELAPGANQEPFTRVAFFSYNNVNQQYEYLSMDSRAPQMMHEKSYADSARSQSQDQRTVTLYMDNFVLPRWGTTTNATFKLRLVIAAEKDRQTMRLYFMPITGAKAVEFLAMEYVYLPRASEPKSKTGKSSNPWTTDLRQAVEQFIEAADKSDSATVAGMYAPDFVNVRVTDEGEVVRLDRVQLLSIFSRIGGHHIPTKTTSIQHVEVVGDTGFVLLTRVKDLGNGWETMFYSLVWKRQDETWLLSREFVHQRSLPKKP